MNITKEVLEKIKCSVCENYLFMAPVYIRNTGEAVCRVCKHPDEQLTRNTQYEALASLVKFPCKYSEEGCTETREFSAGAPSAHEISCDYKQYLCPVLPSGQCDWFGQRSQILQHCHDEHKSKILRSPCTLKHDITKSSLNSYLLLAYDFLFLLHTKICITSGKIYHAVRVFGDPKLVDKFKFTLTIEKGDLVQSKPGRVAPEGCLAIQEDSSVATGINGLLEFLDGYEGTVFKISVAKIVNIIKCQTKNCNGANTEGMLCDKCMSKRPSTRNCKNSDRGCQYNDINDKCTKHETYFCKFIDICPICKRFRNSNNSLSTHYLETHLQNIYTMPSSSNASIFMNYKMPQLQNITAAIPIDNITKYKMGLVCSEIGYLIIEYVDNGCELYFKIFSPIEYENLSKYDCFIKLFYNQGIHIHTKNYAIQDYPLQYLSGQSDWELKVSNTNFLYGRPDKFQFVVLRK